MKHSTLRLFICLLALPFSFLTAQNITFPRPDLPDQLALPPADGPNLVVSRLTVDQVSPTQVKYTFFITNTGNEPASMSQVSAQASLFKLLNGQGSSIPAGGALITGIASLAPGQTIQRSFGGTNLPNTAAYSSICLTIDDGQVLPETQEGDNVLCCRLAAGSTVMNVDLHPVTDGHGNIQVFQKAETPDLVYVKIRNDGPVRAPGTQATVTYLPIKDARIVTKQLLIPEIAPYGSATLSLGIKDYGYICKVSSIQLVCDSGKNIPETDENNNTLSSMICED